MKKILLVTSCLVAFSASTISFADSAQPCKSLEAACKAAGYYKGGAGSGKGLYKDCIEPLANGKTIQGISVPQDDVAGCKSKIDSMNK